MMHDQKNITFYMKLVEQCKC